MSFTIDNGYIQLPIDVDPSAIQNEALLEIASSLPGWVPRDSHIEVLLLEQFAAMTSESAIVAAQVPEAIFSVLGGLFGVNPIQAQAASAFTVWTMVDTKGYTIPAGTIVGYQVLGNAIYQFLTVSPFTVPTGQTSSAFANPNGILIVAQDTGSVFNNLPAQVLTQVTSLSYVQTITSLAPTAGGVDAETTPDYLNRLSSVLQLMTPRPILPSDFAVLSRQVGGVFRAAAFNGIAPFGNLLTTLDGSFNPGIGSWSAIAASCTLSDVTSGTFPHAMNILGPGSGNAQLETTFNSYASPPPPGYQVAANTSYQAIVNFDFATVAKQVQVQANCFDVNGNSTGTFASSNGASVIDSTTKTTGLQLYFTTPPETFTCALEIIVNGIVSTTHKVYQAALIQSPTPANLLYDSSMEQITGVGSLPWSWTITNTAPWGPIVYGSNVNALAALGSGGPQTFTASSQRQRLPAGTYTIAAIVDASHVTAGTPTITVTNDAGNLPITYGTPISSGSAVNIAGTFTLASEGMVQVNFSTNGATTALGQNLVFAEPQILAGDVHTAVPAYTAGPSYNAPGQTANQERTVTVAAVDENGQPLSSVIETNLSNYLQSQREINFIVNVIAPSYTSVDVSYTGVLEPTANPTTVSNAIKAALQAYLSPATWAGGDQEPPVWNAAQTSVWYLSVVGIIDDIPGVQHLESVKIGYTVPSGVPNMVTTDLALPGYAPLPLPGNITGNLTS